VVVDEGGVASTVGVNGVGVNYFMSTTVRHSETPFFGHSHANRRSWPLWERAPLIAPRAPHSLLLLGFSTNLVARTVSGVALIRIGGHQMRGRYGVDHGRGDQAEADA
jgi:hypothetical protein